MKTNQEKLNLKITMDTAISAYIEACTNIPAHDVDYSFINQDIDDVISMCNGTPAEES